MLRQMSLGSGPTGGPKEIIIWAVKALPNGDIVSADSTGEIKIWQGKTYSLMQRIKGHTQDVLSLATSHDGTTIFSGGMDRRTVVYRHIKGKKRWSEIGHRRYHTHDVKTMASLECKGTSVVVSGGPDASPTILPLLQFGQENQRALPFLPQSNVVHSSPRKRLMMTWWDREVHIWRLNRMMDAANNDEEIAPANRKLVAKILIKGEANITSATLSTAGNLLAVATAVDIKMFRLKARKAEEGEGLKVSTIAIPEVFSFGARLIQFSPDGNWLSVIRDDSQVAVARIVPDKSTPATIRILPQLSKLPRIDRKISKDKLLGGLGAYERTITQATFSSDSRILVVSDLTGYVDTWVLEGLEDLTQEPEEVDVDDEASDNSDDEDSSDEEEKKPKLIYGQHWTRNSSASRIPQLPATPVVLSFRPATRPAQTNGTVPRPTRNNPRPISHELPVSEDRLVIITSTNDVYEFEVLAGSLTPWSRRNPTSVFPETFRKLREVTHGCIWDTSNGRERMWLYGVNWLFMFDLSQDLYAPSTGGAEYAENNGTEDLNIPHTSGHKRKRIAYYQGKSGAGGLANPHHNETGMSRKIRKTVQEEDEEGTLVDLCENANADAMDLDSPFEADDDLDDDDNDMPLQITQRAQQPSEEDAVGRKGPAFYKTFKYRPILGIVVIGEGDEEGDGEGTGPEVALVERPIWEADLPARYEGDQEWEKRAYYG
ncbi:U3 small nucleolar RNA-associated protein [Clarireedia jacksonii]